MVLTSEVDTGSLLGTFDLHPYDNFLTVEKYESQYNEAKESVRAKKVHFNLCKHSTHCVIDHDRGDATGLTPYLFLQLKLLQESLGKRKKTKDANTETEDMENGGDEAVEQSKEPQDVAELSFDLEPAALPIEEEIRQEMLQLFPGGEIDVLGDATSTLFAITMLCVAEEYEPQVL